MLRTSSIALFALAAAGAPLSAQSDFEGVTFGDYVLGPRLALEELEGRVVLFEFWGVRCGPCIRGIPYLGKLQAYYGREDLIVIANQCQTQDVREAAKVWRSSGGSEAVSVINHATLPGSDVSSLPHCFLFDHAGELAFAGPPHRVKPSLERALGASPGWMALGMQYQVLGEEAAFFGRREANFAEPMAELRSLLEDESAGAREKTEAEFLLQRIETWADSGRMTVLGLERTYPVRCMWTLEARIDLLEGTNLVHWYLERRDRLERNDEFQDELEADQAYLKLLERGRKAGVFEPPTSSSEKRKIEAFRKKGRSFIKRSDGTIAADRMRTTLSRLHGDS